MKNLKITLVQAKLAWENAEANRKHFTSMLSKVRKGSTDLILLPEMFNTGFTMNASANAETMNGETLAWMEEMAAAKKAVVCGSVIIKEAGKFFNRLLWVQPDGKVLHYNKRHLFRMAGEHHIYSGGNSRLIVEWKGWKICPLVCYDLRFPVWSRNTDQFDLLIYVANWPERRAFAWTQLLVARAIENQCYVAGLNRVGPDGNDIDHKGRSVVLDPLGQRVNTFTSAREWIETVQLDAGLLKKLRKQFPVMMDADRFEIKK